MSQEVALPSEQTNRALSQAPELVHDAPPSALLTWVEEARQANVIANALSQSSFIPASLRGKPQDITAAILTGQEIGLQPMASLRSLDVIQGTPALRANAMRALLQSKGHEIELVESDDQHCVMRGRRYNGIGREVGAWQTVTWDMDRARGLGLAGKDNWKKQPQAMLIARATGEVCRLVASDALHALAYASEELHDSEPMAVAAQRVTMARLTQPQSAVSDATEPAPEPAEAPVEPAKQPTPATRAQVGKIHSLAKELGYETTEGDRGEYLAELSDVTGRDITSSNELTKAEAGDVIAAWTRKAAEAPTFEEPDRAEVYRQVQEAAKQRGFTSDAQLRGSLEQEYGQPVGDIAVEQLTEFITKLSLGTVQP